MHQPRRRTSWLTIARETGIDAEISCLNGAPGDRSARRCEGWTDRESIPLAYVHRPRASSPPTSVENVIVDDGSPAPRSIAPDSIRHSRRDGLAGSQKFFRFMSQSRWTSGRRERCDIEYVLCLIGINDTERERERGFVCRKIPQESPPVVKASHASCESDCSGQKERERVCGPKYTSKVTREISLK